MKTKIIAIMAIAVLFLTNCTNNLWTTGASPIEHIANNEWFLKHEIQQFGKTENGLCFLKTEDFYVLITERNSNVELYYKYLQNDNNEKSDSNTIQNDQLINRITEVHLLKFAEDIHFKIKIIESIENIKITETPKSSRIITIDSNSIIRHALHPNTTLAKKILWTPFTLIADIFFVPVQLLVTKWFFGSYKL